MDSRQCNPAVLVQYNNRDEEESEQQGIGVLESIRDVWARRLFVVDLARGTVSNKK